MNYQSLETEFLEKQPEEKTNSDDLLEEFECSQLYNELEEDESNEQDYINYSTQSPSLQNNQLNPSISKIVGQDATHGEDDSSLSDSESTEDDIYREEAILSNSEKPTDDYYLDNQFQGLQQRKLYI